MSSDEQRECFYSVRHWVVSSGKQCERMGKEDRTYPFRVFLRQHPVHELDSFDSVAEDHYSALAALLVVDVRLVDAVEPFEQLANLLVF